MFWTGVNIDYSQLQARGEQVKAALAGNEVHLTNPNGTDLKLRVQGRPVLVSDGLISADDLKRGGAALAVYLPAGEVYTTPVPGTAAGRIVDSRSFYRGKQIDNLTLTVAGGKVTAMTGAGPGYAGLKAEYDAVQDPRKDLRAARSATGCRQAPSRSARGATSGRVATTPCRTASPSSCQAAP
jgi:leucyl aminopeptidase (aminopeptidase T)